MNFQSMFFFAFEVCLLLKTFGRFKFKFKTYYFQHLQKELASYVEIMQNMISPLDVSDSLGALK